MIITNIVTDPSLSASHNFVEQIQYILVIVTDPSLSASHNS